MPLFKLSDQKLTYIKEKSLKSERELQVLIESNLNNVFSLEFIESEFAPQGDLRIDTLAFDPEQCSFVIIEYKKGSSWSVIDQGFAYLALMLNHKADFVLRYNEKAKASLGIKDINWEASRILFISPNFNSYQREALGFQNLPIELWEFDKYESDIVALRQMQSGKRAAKLSEVQIGTSVDVQRVQREVRSYTVDDHFKDGKWIESRELYDELLPNLLNLDSRLQVRPVKYYIGLHIDGFNVFALHVYKSKIELHFSRSVPKDFKDPEKRVEYLKNSMKHYNQHISAFTLKNADDISYAVMLAKQALHRFNQGK